MRKLLSRPARLAAGIAVLLCVGACSSSSTREEAMAADIRATYAEFFTKNHFAYVVLTYPESVEALPAEKRIEFRTVQTLLGDLDIDWDAMRHDQARVRFQGARGDQEYVGYYLPEQVAAKYHDEPVLFLNFHAGTAQAGTVHPYCAKNHVQVRVVTDPIRFGPAS